LGKGKRNREYRKKNHEDARGETKFAWREAMRAEARGGSVGLEISDYINAHKQGPRRVCEALIARHNARIMQAPKMPKELMVPIRSHLLAAVGIDGMLQVLGRDPMQMPASYLGSWKEHLLWSVDSCHAVLRYVSSGQFVAAAMILRTQLERWTNDLAEARGVQREKGVSNIDFMNHVWQCAGDDRRASTEPTAPSLGLEEGDEYEKEDSSGNRFGVFEINSPGVSEYLPGQIFSELSELIHARGQYTKVAHWEMAYLLDSKYAPQKVGLSLVLAKGVSLVLSRVYQRVSELMPDARSGQEAIDFQKPPPAGINSFPKSSIWPMTYRTCYDPQVYNSYKSGGALYQSVLHGQRPIGRLFRDDELLDIAFVERRFRALVWAREAFEVEKKKFGDDFNPGSLESKQLEIIVTSEFASLLAHWSPVDQVKKAAAVASSSLRSSYWLWLEDDDRAMGMLRVVTEQTARMRTWNRKPEKAALLEENPKTTPKDWIEKSGLKRISAFNNALGEMAHARESLQWPAARQVLTKLQLNEDSPDPEKTARGFALDAAVMMLAREVLSALQNNIPECAKIFESALEEANVDYEKLEELLNEWFDFVHKYKTSQGQ
jgi:hypothetical protein